MEDDHHDAGDRTRDRSRNRQELPPEAVRGEGIEEGRGQEQRGGRNCREDVGNHLRLRKGEKEEYHPCPEPQEKPRVRRRRGLPKPCRRQEERPGQEEKQEYRQVPPERLVAMVHRGREPLQVLVDEEEPEEFGVLHAHRDEPGRRYRKEERTARPKRQPAEDSETPREEEVEPGDPRRKYDADEPLREHCEGGKEKEEVVVG